MDGVRRHKDDIAFQTLGAIDEAQVTLGVCRSLLLDWQPASGNKRVRPYLLKDRKPRPTSVSTATVRQLTGDLTRIQNELLIAGGILSASPGDNVPDTMPRIGTKEIEVLSEAFKRWRNAVHIEPRFFIAGDSRLGAEFDRARTIVRRAERSVVGLIRERGNQEQIPVSQYLNQLSDLCFVLARWADSVS